MERDGIQNKTKTMYQYEYRNMIFECEFGAVFLIKGDHEICIGEANNKDEFVNIIYNYLLINDLLKEK